MNNKKRSRELTLKIVVRFVVASVIYVIALLLLYAIAYLLVHLFTWQPYEYLYIFLSRINDYSYLILFVLWIAGEFGIFIYYWNKSLSYLDHVVSATRKIYTNPDEPIFLPPILNEIEYQMNQIRYDMHKSQNAAKEAEQRKNDLIVYLAHDLKTPLTSVIGYLTLLHDENQISEELREKYTEISLDKALRLEDLINEFFEITRFNLTTLSLEMSRVNLTRMLEQLIYEFMPMLEEKGLSCSLKIEPDLYIRCDVDKMQRAFDNLLRNAINYSFENNEIVIDVSRKLNEIFLKFMNHGNTIPKEKLSRIFEQFYRLDSSRTSKTGGAGLGLAITKEIVELHGGTITAVSEDEMIEFEIILSTDL